MVGGDQDDPQIDEFDEIDCQINLPQQIFDDEVEDCSDQSSDGGQLDEHLIPIQYQVLQGKNGFSRIQTSSSQEEMEDQRKFYKKKGQ